MPLQRIRVAFVSMLLGILVWGCGDHASPIEPSVHNTRGVVGGVTINSITPPSDNCSVDPTGYGCPRPSFDGTTGCPEPCTKTRISSASYSSMGNAVRQALQHINTLDSQCQTLANFAEQRLNLGLMYWYQDDFGFRYNDWGDAHAWPGTYDPYAEIDIASYTFSTNNSGGQLTKTLIHEAAHGYYGTADESYAEYLGSKCYI